jgi:small subunit ribosomal protein S1
VSNNLNKRNDFSALLDEFMGEPGHFEHKVVKGVICAIDEKKKEAVIEVGLKSEGRVPISDIMGRLREVQPKIGDVIEVYVERLEDKHGSLVLSIEKAKKEKAWEMLDKAFKENLSIKGVIFSRVKGGYAVDLDGLTGFLPGSQVDLRPTREAAPLNEVIEFKVLKIDRPRNNIVVSHRMVLEEEREKLRHSIVDQLEEGQIVKGVVKNITEYGAFVDLGGIDGLLHVTDISWTRVQHPSEYLKHLGQELEVQILKFNKETGRISLGLKQLQQDPWAGIQERYKPGQRVRGTVSSIAEYGVFVRIEPAIEGLIHISEISWISKNLHPEAMFKVGDEVEVMVLDVDESKRRLGLGYKQCLENPWEKLRKDFPVGTIFEGKISKITEFGIFVNITDKLDGMVHMSDISWEDDGVQISKNYKHGQPLKVKVLDIDPTRERISLGVKQLVPDAFQEEIGNFKRGDVLKGQVSYIKNSGIEITIEGTQLKGFIKMAELSRNKSEQRADLYKINQEVEAKIIQFDRQKRQIMLSIRSLELDEEKRLLANMRKDSASLGNAFEEIFQG